MTDAHYPTFNEFLTKTDWTKYGRGNDPRCEDCMMHSGYEPSAILGGNKKLGDMWRMLSWQMSGRMGGSKGAGNGHSSDHSPSHANGNGHAQQPAAVGAGAPAKEEAFRIL
jgi:hypothetical protein